MHEKFCLLIIEGKDNAAAYQGAGYTAKKRDVAQVAARRLLRERSVINRIAELQRQMISTTEVTVVSLMQEAAIIQRDALHDRNQSAAVNALVAKAKIAGLWIERTESENVNLNYTICDTLPSEEQWQAERTERDDKPGS